MTLYVKKLMDIKHNQRNEMAKVLMKKQPNNPFFMFLSGASKQKVTKRKS